MTIESHESKSFVDMCNKAVDQGWVPCGGISTLATNAVDKDGNDLGMVVLRTQAFVKYNTPVDLSVNV